MIKFSLKNGVEVIPTSFHGCRFNDGTVFEPTPEEIEQIKKDWSCLTVQREFHRVEIPRLEGIGATTSISKLTDEAMDKLYKIQHENPNAIILVSFMIVDALCAMEWKHRYPHVLSTNATAETQRSAPQDKIWDINNFSAGR